MIGREKGYHGVGFGGISVGGLVNNRRIFPADPGRPPAPHAGSRPQRLLARACPSTASNWRKILSAWSALHGAETIAAVIVEPMSGSAGVILPPKGYLERLRAIADKYGILLIFDEVITGFGRLGTPFATDYFGVVPDLVTTAKGLTNGAIPMGAVFAKPQGARRD
jgi:beta-alanine--pyruvate transaminase